MMILVRSLPSLLAARDPDSLVGAKVLDFLTGEGSDGDAGYGVLVGIGIEFGWEAGRGGR
ncbi:hypothetical protein V2J09_013870 [Rumex salicifolius]